MKPQEERVVKTEEQLLEMQREAEEVQAGDEEAQGNGATGSAEMETAAAGSGENAQNGGTTETHQTENSTEQTEATNQDSADIEFILRVPVLQPDGPSTSSAAPHVYLESSLTHSHHELCGDCSSKMRLVKADEQAKQRYGFIETLVVAIPRDEFRQVVDKIEREKNRKRKRNRAEEEDEDLIEKQLRSTERMLKHPNKVRRLSKTMPPVVEGETPSAYMNQEDVEEQQQQQEMDFVEDSQLHEEDQQQDNLLSDSEDDTRDRVCGSPTPTASNEKKVKKKKTTKKPLSARQSKAVEIDDDGDDDDEEDGEEWLSKSDISKRRSSGAAEEAVVAEDNGIDKEEDGREVSDSEQESGSDNSTEPLEPNKKMTRQQYHRDKELRQLLKEKNMLNLEENGAEQKEDDDDDQQVLTEENLTEEDESAVVDAKKEEKEQSPKKKKRRCITSDTQDSSDIEYSPQLDTDGFECLTLSTSFSGKKKEPPAKKGRGKTKKKDEGGKEMAKKKMTAKKRHNPKEKKPAVKKKRSNRVILASSDEEEEEDDDDDDIEVEELKAMADEEKEELDKLALSDEEHSKAKRIIPKKKLQERTKEAERAEKERRKRLEEKQREFNGIELIETEEGVTSTCQQVQVLKSIILDLDRGSDAPMPVKVHPSLVAILKKHQAEGIKFLYNCTIESLDRLEDGGGGAILGHCMGLGKTLQIIAFLHTVLMHPRIKEKINKVLVVVPKNVVLNWMQEFERWLYNNDPETDDIIYTELDSPKDNKERLKAIKRWLNFEKPAVLIIGYEMYRILTLLEEDIPVPERKGRSNKEPKKKKKPTAKEKELAKLKPELRKLLHEGPHMVICDEGHKLKNCTTGIFCTMSKIVTKRRICMTGTPLQNKLEEYYCMVNFVKSNLLGTPKEYKNRFVNIINQGRAKDASKFDVIYMRRRCHILFERLKGILDRRDYTVLRDSLPPKQEYVINVRLTMAQIDLYRQYLEFTKKREVGGGFYDQFGEFQSGKGIKLLQDHIMLYRIWTHPYLLLEHERNEELKRIRRGDDLNDFVASDDEGEDSDEVVEDSDVEEHIGNGHTDGPSTSKSAERATKGPATRGRRPRLRGDGAAALSEESIRPETPPEMQEWAKNFVSEEDRNKFELSHKLLLLVEVIKKCEEIGDKLLVFSQFLQSLRLIERMLAYMANNNLWFVDGHQPLMAQGEQWAWQKKLDYEVIEGSVGSLDRDRIQKDFNHPLNLRNRLLLLSTKAASLGTNLIGANRVVIFDCCWNPSHDTQSLFRVYRFGQIKPVYIYRFVAQGTMEERIYNRQVTKESIAKRVTESAQVQRHYTTHELDEMYDFQPEMPVDPSDSQAPHLDPPKDRLLGDIILKGTEAIVNYHPHDMLFDELEDEKLTDKEREEAWREYERDRDGLPRPSLPLPTAENGGPMQGPQPLSASAQAVMDRQQLLIAQIRQGFANQHAEQQQQGGGGTTNQVQVHPALARMQMQQQMHLALQESLLQQQRVNQQMQQGGDNSPQQLLQKALHQQTIAHLNQRLQHMAVQQREENTAAAARSSNGMLRNGIMGSVNNSPGGQQQQYNPSPPRRGFSSAMDQQAQFASNFDALTKNYHTDTVFAKCLQVKDMKHKTAMLIFQIKQFLRYFVSQVPEHQQNVLGTMNNAEKFEQYFLALVQRALDTGEDWQSLYQNALLTLKTTVGLVQDVPECVYGINFAMSMFSKAFDA